MYYIPLLLTIIANVLYHISQKNTSAKINPMFSLFVTYGIALIITFLLFFILKGDKSFQSNAAELNWATIVLGCSLVLLELGFLLAYRAGWNIGTASILSTIVVTLTLVPVGLLFFKEPISVKNLIGIITCIVGILLINAR